MVNKNLFKKFVFCLLLFACFASDSYGVGAPNYRPDGPHPRILLDSAKLAELRAERDANTARWQGFRNWLTTNYPATNYDLKCPGDAACLANSRSINWDGHNFVSYRGLGWLENIISYALAYQVYKDTNLTLAEQYGNQCVDIINNMIRVHSVGEEDDNGILMMRSGDAIYNLTNNQAEVDAAITAGEVITPTYRPGKYGYPSRAMMALPIAYDWLYDLLTPAERSLWQDVMFRYYDWIRGVTSTYNDGVVYGGVRYHEQKDDATLCATPGNVCTGVTIDSQTRAASWDDVGDNFWSGHFALLTLVGAATYGDNPDAAAYWDYAKTEMWENKLKAYWNSPQWGLGGDAVEGWHYGGGFFREYQTLLGLNTATGYNFFTETNHPQEVVQSYIHANAPNLYDMYNHGQWYATNPGRPFDYHIFMPKAVLQAIGDTTWSAIAQDYMNKANFAVTASVWEEFLFNKTNPTTTDFRTVLPLYYWSEGSGLFSFHSTWQDQPDAVSSWFQLGFGTRSTHENYDEGAFQIMRGNDKLIWDAGLQRDEWRQSVIRFGTTGTVGSQKPWGEQWVLDKTVLGQEHIAAYDYVKADVRGGYQKYYYNSKSAEIYYKHVLYLRPNLFVIYDVTKTDPMEPDKWKDYRIQFPGTPVIDEPSQTITNTNGSSKVYVKMLYPSGVTYSSGDESTGYKWVDARPNVVQEYDQFLHVIEATVAGQAKMTSNVLVSSAGGNARGTYISDDTRESANWLAMFTADQDGQAVSTDIVYTLPGGKKYQPRHFFADLPPGSTWTFVAPANRLVQQTFKLLAGSFPGQGKVVTASDHGTILIQPKPPVEVPVN